MKRKGSRYEKTRKFSDMNRFRGCRERRLSHAPGMVEHTVLHTDRLDYLANNYYKRDRRWWRIMDANPDFFYGVELLDETMHSDVILIPAARESET